jgi:hypothetical protein
MIGHNHKEGNMKKVYFFMFVLFVLGVSAVAGRESQTLTHGHISIGNMTPGAVHTYRILPGNDAEYYIAWDDYDTNYDFADIIVGVRGEEWGQYLIDVQDHGNFGRNLHRLVNQNHQGTKRNPLNLATEEWDESGPPEFVPNREYIIEVRGWNRSSSGAYRIVFY